jgi:16S rRNA (guanine527-N7)-methyltransferase
MKDDRAAALAIIGVNKRIEDRLAMYVGHLQRWRNVTNLMSEDAFSQVWTRHIADSAQLLWYAPTARRWIDVGSGAGFPGMVIAILLSETPGAEVHCIESNYRKCAFLQFVAREIVAPAVIHAERIELLDPSELPSLDAVTSRALAPLPRLVNYTYPWLSNGATGIFPCGRSAVMHIDGLAAASEFEVESFQNRLALDAQIVRVRRRELRQK